METKNNSLNNNSLKNNCYDFLTTCYMPGITKKVFIHWISFQLHYNTVKGGAIIISIL